MEDLYGNLPPPSAHSAENGFSIPEIGTSWISVNTRHGKSDTNPMKISKSSTVSTVDSKKPAPVVTGSKFVPSTLLFKPRQTAVPINQSVPSSSSCAPTPSGSTGKIRTIVAMEEIVGNSEISGPTLGQANIPAGPQLLSINDFNLNSSFDVVQPYDPRKPNDYSQFCNEREEEKRIMQLAIDNKKKLEEIEKARVEVERKRKLAVEQGDYQSLLSSALLENSGIGRGRGRGVANLPSWIVEQMKSAEMKEHLSSLSPDAEQYKDAPTENENLTRVAGGRQKSKVSHYSKPSKVIMLKNMVAPGDVDETLGNETKMECQKYGCVLSCEVCLLDKKRYPSFSESEQVRVFVQFDRQDSAVKAFK